MDFQFISSTSQLKKICDFFLEEKIIGVDLEADSMHCFNEKICLIQIACKDRAFLIDPFEIKELGPFLDVLKNPEVIKVFHGADFDIRSLDRDYQTRVNNLFDTEIACRFTGDKERGLAALLMTYFDVTADKRFQKVDWSIRPLTPEMLDYSVMDVAYLEQLYTILKDRLVQMGRYEWAKEEFELQEQVRYENNHTAPLFVRFKGAGKMDNRSLAVLENMLALRLKIAGEKDRPVFKVFSNQTLKSLAEQKPDTVEKMVKDRILSPKQARMYGAQCEQAVKKAMDLPHKDLPSYPRTRRPKPDPKVRNRMKVLKKMREKRSEALDLEPGILLNNAIITAVAVDNPGSEQDLLKTNHIRNWQVEVLGDEILAVLAKA